MYIKYEQRVVACAEYISRTGNTVRDTAKKFGLSKSTVHKDMISRLPSINPELFEKVRKILDINKAERHLRGGIATRNKYFLQRDTAPNSASVPLDQIREPSFN